MPMEFDCRTEAPRPSPPPRAPAPHVPQQEPRDMTRMLLIGAFMALVAAFAVGLYVFVDMARSEIVREQERNLLVGRCFDNGIGGIGRLIEVWNLDRGLLAFPDGHTTPYPFNMISETQCPQASPTAPHEASHG